MRKRLTGLSVPDGRGAVEASRSQKLAGRRPRHLSDGPLLSVSKYRLVDPLFVIVAPYPDGLVFAASGEQVVGRMPSRVPDAAFVSRQTLL